MNNLSRWMRAQVFDTISALARVDEWDVAPAVDTYCWAVGNGGAPYPNATGLTVKNLAGPIAHKLAAVDGNDVTFPVYYLAADELQTTFAAADPTNPRIDLICIKLDHNPDTSVTRDFMSTGGVLSSQSFNSSRSVRITKTVVTGTPGVSPVEPSVPAGYVRYCAVRIPAAATNLSAIDFYDHRVPVGFRIVDVMAQQGAYDEAKWTWFSTGARTHSGTSDPAQTPFSFPYGAGPHTRVVGVQLMSAYNGGSSSDRAIQLNRIQFPLSSTLLETVTSGLLASTGGVLQYRGITPAKPTWGDGTFAGYANRHAALPLNPSTVNLLMLTYLPSATSGHSDNLYVARFLVCG